MRLVRLGFDGALLLLVGVALEGASAQGQCPTPQQVVIVGGAAGSDLPGAALGALGTPRTISSGTQDIGCTSLSVSGAAPLVSCFASNGSLFGSCMTSDPAMMAIVSRLTPQSILNFSWDADGACTQITVKTAACNP